MAALLPLLPTSIRSQRMRRCIESTLPGLLRDTTETTVAWQLFALQFLNVFGMQEEMAVKGVEKRAAEGQPEGEDRSDELVEKAGSEIESYCMTCLARAQTLCSSSSPQRAWYCCGACCLYSIYSYSSWALFSRATIYAAQCLGLL